MRHSAAHIMAAAVCELYPEVKLDIGPATDDGFYYDFDMPHRIVPEDFAVLRSGSSGAVRYQLLARKASPLADLAKED